VRKAGFDAVYSSEISLATAEDELILQRGRSEGRIVITLDADFDTLMELSGEK
jgi:predicted nuclease of predicted toxin-antitoxin system